MKLLKLTESGKNYFKAAAEGQLGISSWNYTGELFLSSKKLLVTYADEDSTKRLYALTLEAVGNEEYYLNQILKDILTHMIYATIDPADDDYYDNLPALYEEFLRFLKYLIKHGAAIHFDRLNILWGTIANLYETQAEDLMPMDFLPHKTLDLEYIENQI